MAEDTVIAGPDRVLTITLNRPESHNALTPEMITTLTRLFQDVGEMPGAGDCGGGQRRRSFCRSGHGVHARCGRYVRTKTEWMAKLSLT
ncbi:MAG: hypothetical protein R3C44_15215 [Chloroflexota bacterium]